MIGSPELRLSRSVFERRMIGNEGQVGVILGGFLKVARMRELALRLSNTTAELTNARREIEQQKSA